MAPTESEFWSQRIRTIFTKARQLPAGPLQAKFLRNACGRNEILRRKIKELLESEEIAESYFEEFMHIPSTETPKAMIGSSIRDYRIIGQLSGGGFADVYQVELAGKNHRKLAMKVIKPGMNTRDVHKRFAIEREALAMMDHPNTVHLHDSGTTGDGRPFLIMDLVCGIPITKYCDQNDCSLEERLKLFKTVCSAVEDIHRKGILHRDLKPSNILVVTNHKGDFPVVIDFGIAKFYRKTNRRRAVISRSGIFMGTPAYMSPEQFTTRSNELDPRTDVYSLGIVLYELITGIQPFRKQSLQGTSKAEVHRIICEEHPQKPSAVLRTMDKKAHAPTSKLSGPIDKSVGRLKGNLDAIVMKGIEKDRNRRYWSAKDFGRDIERHLQHRRVEARAPVWIGLLRKYNRKLSDILRRAWPASQ